MGECPGGARGPRDRAETPRAASNDNDPSPAAPALPIPLAARFGWVSAFAQAERANAIAHGALIIERRA
jgi:hypothetical protein